MVRVIARLLWLAPTALTLLAVNQAIVAYELRATWTEGQSHTAEVIAWERSNRADVTYGYVSLRVPLAEGDSLVKEKMSLPYTLLPRLEGQETLAVRVREGARQEVVIDRIMPAHWLIAASHVGISLLCAVLLFAGVIWWNASLRRKDRQSEQAFSA